MLLVSAADKVHNARSLVVDLSHSGDAVWSHFKGGRDGTLWYFRSLVAAYREAKPPAPVTELIDELERLVGELERLAARTP